MSHKSNIGTAPFCQSCK